MSEYTLHFNNISDLIAIERRLVRALSRDPELLPKSYQHLLRYAINLAKMGWLRTPSGHDVTLGGVLASYRHWLRDQLLPLIPRHFVPDSAGLLSIGPLVAIRTNAMRHALLARYRNDFGADTLDRELRFKQLALVLGGGGGSGLAHFGLFSLLHDMDLEPSYIAGASMGSLVGLIRAMQRRYDPRIALRALTQSVDLRQVFRPFTGVSRYGFPGALTLDLVPMAQSVLKTLLNQPLPRFEELPIPLEVVVTGIHSGWNPDAQLEDVFSKAAAGGLSSMSTRSRIKLFFRTVKQLVSNPSFLKPLVFNDEPGTASMRAIDAIGFSCAVPGLLHFDILDAPEDPSIIRPLDALFERHRLFRLADGGVINNVPSDVAWTSIQKGKIGSRNAFIFGVDVFAPMANRNALFIPVQQIARQGVIAQRPFSDYTKTLRTSPSPIKLAPSLPQLQRIARRTRDELLEDVPFIHAMMTPIPPFERWYSQLYLPGAVYG